MDQFLDERTAQWVAVTVVDFFHWAERQADAERLLSNLHFANEVVERLQAGQPVTQATCICARGAAEQVRSAAALQGFEGMVALLDEMIAFFRECIRSVPFLSQEVKW